MPSSVVTKSADEYLERLRTGLLHQEVEQRGVAPTGQLGAGDRAGPGPALEFLRVVADPRLAQSSAFSPSDSKTAYVDVRPDREREVGRQGPWRGGPDGHLLRRRPGLGLELEPHRQRRVLPVAIDVVHPGLGVGQRRLAAPAVREHPEALVDQALVVQRLERPHDAFHVGQVQRLVVVGEIDPAGLPGDVALPVLGVAQHRVMAGLVELRHAEFQDLLLGGQAELLLRLHLGGQAVAVPAEPPLHPAPAHGLVARHDVLDVAGEQVAVVRQPVGERWPVVEDVLVGPVRARVTGLDGRDERLVVRPVVEHAALDLGQVRARRYADGVAAARRGALGVRHGGRSPRARMLF